MKKFSLKSRLISLTVAASMVLALVPVLSVYGLNGTASYKPAESNISSKYWVSATADSGTPALAIDGDAATAWQANGKGDHWLLVDLGGTYDAVRKTEVVFDSVDKAYKYVIEGSEDGAAWQVLADRANNSKVTGGFTDIFSRKATRYIKLTVKNADYVGVSEFKIINYLRDDLDNGSDTSGFTTNTTYYNANNNPPAPDGIRGGVMNDASVDNGNNFFGLTKDMGWDTIRLRIWNEPRSEGSWQADMITEDSPLEAFPTGNPTGNCSPTATRTVAKYVKGAGQNLAIDFHYADSWSDPQNQPKPYAWADLPFESADPATNDLVKQTYQFTYDMIKSLIDQGTTPTIVALGNEITNGMMWGSEYKLTNPYAHFHDYYKRFVRGNENAARGGGVKWIKYEEAAGDKTSAAYAEFLDSVVHLAKLVDAGNRAIAKLNDEYDIDIQTEMHFAFNVFEQPANQPKVSMDPDEVYEKVVTLVGGLADNLDAMGGMVDRIGVSYYPDWHGTYAQVQRNVVELSKLLPGVKFNIAECSPASSGTVTDWMSNPNHEVGFTYSTQSQGDDTIDILKTINDVPNNVGQGVWPWNGQSVYFTGGQPRASFKVWKEAFATGIVESGVYVTTKKGAAPLLPASVSELTVATGAKSSVSVTWDAVDPEDYATEGVFEVKGVAAATGNMTDVTATVSVVDRDVPGLYPDTVDASTRNINFNDGWKFLLATPLTQVANAAAFRTGGLPDVAGYETAKLINPSYDDSGWRSLSVPHDWSIEGQKVSSGSSSSQGYLLGGLGWYRKTFNLPAELEGAKKIYIDFQGVYQNSIVYLNGEEIGNYPSGYTGFSYDLTDKLKFGAEGSNVLVVKVQNASPSGRWYTGSGIVRPVTLVVTDLVRFERNGVFLTSPTLETTYAADKSAELNVRATVYSDDSNGLVALRTTVYDGAAVVATQTTDALDINPTSSIDLNGTVRVPNAKLWSIDDPFRYNVSVEVLYEKNGTIDGFVSADKLDYKYGFRYFEIDPKEGLYLNGKYVKMQGVDLHHDSGALGGAAFYDAFKREMTILKGMGVNAYRSSHNPPAKEMIDVCSELGIIVMEEAYDGWGGAKATYDFGVFFLTPIPAAWSGVSYAKRTMPTEPQVPLWSDWVIQEMVYRDVNEPSVLMWSVGNEIRGYGTRPGDWYNWNNYLQPGDPAPTATYTATTINEYTEGMRLRANILKADKTRKVAIGHDGYRTPPTSGTWFELARVFDGVGLNYNTARSVDVLMDRFPNTFFFESESSSQTGARGVYFDASLANTPANQTPGTRGTSSYDNNFSSWTMPNEYGLKKDRDRKGFLGQFIWSGFDYIGEPTPYGVYPVGVSSFGTTDTAGFPKDSYYLFKSQWTDEGMAHIVPMNWNDWRQGEEVEVWVNTNAYSAELFLDGQSLGVKTFDTKATTYGKNYYETTEPTKDNGGSGYKTGADTNPNNPGGYVSPNGSYGKLHLTWNVPFAPGALRVIARDEAGRIVAEDTIRTAEPAYTIRLKPDKDSVAEGGLVYVETEVVDRNGVVVPSANNLVKFDVDGGGSIVGVDNGKQESSELYKWGNVEKNSHSEREAYNGKVLVIVQSGKGGGAIKLTASSENLVPVTLEIASGVAPKTTAPSLASVVSAQRKAVTVAKGDVTTLPKDVKVTYASGVTLVKEVTWEAIETTKFNVPGLFTVRGAFVDSAVTIPAFADVTVTEEFTRANVGLNAAAGAQDYKVTTGPLATASFTRGTNYPNRLIDGNRSTTWDNGYNASQTVVLNAISASRPYESVQTYWPSEKTFDQVSLYFNTGTVGTSIPTAAIPESLNVEYWDGLKWVSARNQSAQLATASAQESKVTFAPVTASRVRVTIKNATPYSSTTGSFIISEFETWGNNPSGAAAAEYNIIYDANGGTGTIAKEPRLAGTTVRLAAASAITPPADKRFKEWNTDRNGTGAAFADGEEFLMPSSDITLYAIWVDLASFTVTASASPTAGGTISNIPAGKTEVGGDVALRARAAAGYTFERWSVTGLDGYNDIANPLKFAMPDSNVRVIAIFKRNEPDKKYTVTTGVVPTNGGTVTSTAPSDGLTVGTEVTLTAKAAPGYTFDRWAVVNAAVTDENANPLTITMPEVSIGVMAVFVEAGISTTIVPVTGISVGVSSLINTIAGKKVTASARVLPENATNQDIIWSSSNTKIATVENGVITARTSGVAVITAKAAGDENISKFFTVRVQ